MLTGQSGSPEWPARAALALSCLAVAACGRPAVASLLPLLEVGLSAHRLRSGATDAELARDAERWQASAFVALRFQPRTAAAALPLRGALAPETWILPCDSEDTICLQEVLEAESELKRALGELQ